MAPGARAPDLGPGPTLALSAFGLGRAPFAPGTAASLATAALLYAAHLLCGPAALLGGALVLIAYGTVATLRWGGAPKRPGGGGDPGWVVADEVAGQALAMLGVLAGDPVVGTAAAFLLFRLFDISKMWPVGRLERVPGGAGVLLDDLAAGALAGVLVALGIGLGGLSV